MDLKRESARFAFKQIKNDSHVGLGDGMTIRYLADYIKEAVHNGLSIGLSTSSVQTENYLHQLGLPVIEISGFNHLDQYFDGCDQLDHALNAFKSGAGIHTTEKLLASMTKQFILLADSSKYVPKLDNQFPLVLEILPLATTYVIQQMEVFFPGILLSIRIQGSSGPAKTRYGNFLIDCRFPNLPAPQLLQLHCKAITGVVEISLFYQIAHQAIIVDEKKMRRFERTMNGIVLAEQTDYPDEYTYQ